MNKIKLSLILILLAITSTLTFTQVIPIDSVRRQDANGVPLLLNQTVTVRGVVTTQRELGNSLVYFQDATAGLVAFDTAFCSGVNRGDSVQVTGVVTQYNGLTELQPVTSFTVLATNRTFTPITVTPSQIRNTTGELYEGRLIKIDSITQVKNTSGVPVTIWTVTGSGTNYRIFKGTDSCEIRIYATTNIANSIIAPFPFSVTAVNSQFDSSPPYNSGYQILPRSLTDFGSYSGGGPLLSSITYTNILPTSVTISWTTSAPSDSKVRYMITDSNYQVANYTDSVYDAAQVTNHSMTLTGLQSGRIYYFSVRSTNGSGTTTSPLQYFCTQSTSSGTTNIYFNKSVDTTLNSGELAQGNVNMQPRLITRINAAQHSIDFALYSFDDLTQIRDALINAKIRGVKLRFVYDSRTNQDLVNDLISAGIPIQKRNQNTSSLMHNKFFVFDYRNRTSAADDWVWTGSTNITNAQLYTDANNSIEIQDQTLAAIYTREFEEMWGTAADLPNPSNTKFGPNKTDNVPHIVNIAGTRMDVIFSPGDNPSTQIENVINNTCDDNVYFCIYAFTRCSIQNRMYAKHQAGKNIRGVFDSGQSSDNSSVYRTMKGLTGGACPPIWAPPADVWIDTQTGQLHHKYILIDATNAASNPVTITGSYNFSNAATFDNDENFLIVYSPRVANLYLQEFSRRYTESGGTNPIGITQISTEVPKNFSLEQNYPNPFNPSSNINYSIAKSGLVTIKVYNTLGHEVSILVNQLQQAGTYQVNFDGGNFPSGVYFYTLSAGDFTETKKMVLIK